MTVPVGADFEHGAKLSTKDLHPDVYLSVQIKEFLAGIGESADEILSRPLTVAPAVDDSHPLPSYFISSSHNTYLLSHQLWGSASAVAYTHVIKRHGRCVEIDAWDSPNGPKVTHGFTLTDRTTFRDVCEAILAPVKDNHSHWPILISLECHASHETQVEMVKIMKEVFGSKLVDSALEGIGEDRKVTPRDLNGRIVMIVEWHSPKSVDDADTSSSSSSEDDDKPGLLSRLTGRKEKQPPRPPICPELSELGLYANSIKVNGDFTSQDFSSAPINRLFNISESAILKLLPHSLTKLVKHGAQHLCRVYPKGTRVGSANLDPLKYWRAGSQIAALNWQNYDKGMQLNNAMFDGTNGWVLKPASFLNPDSKGPQEKVTLTIDVVGASNCT
ncbi:hypothetical protein FRC02_008365 [Tulasnella sp. 418]|nr:hypothetical protein FRC02_008365 [Tulasnella sp. 418]